jgi:Uma2 family endonuclease
MTAMTTLPFARPLTRADLEHTPDDGHRYELIDGMLLVSPAPGWRHQTVLLALASQLKRACPEDLTVTIAPFAVALTDDTEVQSDLLVAPRAQFTEKELPGAPLLAVEILSPSTQRVDLLLKRDRYEAAGIPSYWIVDPERPVVTVLELVDGTYQELARAQGSEPCRVNAPFPITIVADQLLD